MIVVIGSVIRYVLRYVTYSASARSMSSDSRTRKPPACDESRFKLAEFEAHVMAEAERGNASGPSFGAEPGFRDAEVLSRFPCVAERLGRRLLLRAHGTGIIGAERTGECGKNGGATGE